MKEQRMKLSKQLSKELDGMVYTKAKPLIESGEEHPRLLPVEEDEVLTDDELIGGRFVNARTEH